MGCNQAVHADIERMLALEQSPYVFQAEEPLTESSHDNPPKDAKLRIGAQFEYESRLPFGCICYWKRRVIAPTRCAV